MGMRAGVKAPTPSDLFTAMELVLGPGNLVVERRRSRFWHGPDDFRLLITWQPGRGFAAQYSMLWQQLEQSSDPLLHVTELAWGWLRQFNAFCEVKS